MASREEKIASARKKLKKFQQRGVPKSNKAQLNMSAPSQQGLVEAGNGPVSLSSTLPGSAHGRQWTGGDAYSSKENKPEVLVNGLDSRSLHSGGSHAAVPAAVSTRPSPLVNGSSAQPSTMSSQPRMTSSHAPSSQQQSHVPSQAPLTPVQAVTRDFLPGSTSTPKHGNAGNRRADLAPDSFAVASESAVSPTHFGYRTAAAGAAGGVDGNQRTSSTSRTSSSGVTTASNGVLNVTTAAVAAPSAAARHTVASAPSHAHQQQQQPVSLYQDTIDVENVKKQLLAHQQTIDVLVDEKNSLQNACSKYDQLVRERDASVLDVTLQLKATVEQREALQSQLALREAALRRQAGQPSDAEVADLNTQLRQSRQQVEESHQQASELSRKVQSLAAECMRTREEKDRYAEKLQTTSTLLQQASSDGSAAELRRSHQVVVDEKARLEEQMSNVSASLQRAVEERDLAVQQCRQALEQTTNVKQHLDQERANMKQQQSQLQQLFQQQAAQINDLKHQLDLARLSGDNVSIEKLQGMQRSLQALAVEKQSLVEELSKQSSHAGDLQRLGVEQVERIRQLEEHVARASEASTGRHQLIGAMQADKAAISQATVANRDLRVRIEEMESLQSKADEHCSRLEQQLSSNQEETRLLEERLGQKTDLLRQVQTELVASKTDVESLHSENDDLSDQLAKHVQMANRRQHLEAQSQLTGALQQELTAAQDAIKCLQGEKDQLRQTVLQQQSLINAARDLDTDEERPVPAPAALTPSQGANENTTNALSQRVKVLEEERSRLVGQLQEQSQLYQQQVAAAQDNFRHHHQQHMQPSQQSAASEIEEVHQSDAGGVSTAGSLQAIPRQQYDTVQTTLEELQERFLTIMTEKADLVQKVHSLEHVAGQLEGETDTIGEYIALYQLQRDTLRKRYERKDEYIEQLQGEQDRMETKVAELYSLVVDLVADRKSLIGRLLQLQSNVSCFSATDTGFLTEANTPARPHDVHQEHRRQFDSPVTGTSTPAPAAAAAQNSLGVPSVPGVFEGDDSELFDAHLSQLGSPLPNPGFSSSMLTPNDSCESLPAVIAANAELRAEKILALLHELKPSLHVPPVLVQDDNDVDGHASHPGQPRIGIDMEFLPCSYCEGRLIRI